MNHIKSIRHIKLRGRSWIAASIGSVATGALLLSMMAFTPGPAGGRPTQGWLSPVRTALSYEVMSRAPRRIR